MNQIPWGTALAVFIGAAPLVLPLIALVGWQLMETKTGFAAIRAELLQIRGELAQIKTEVALIRERVAVLEERDRLTHQLVK